MADIKKNQNRDELFRTIYKIATDLVHAGHVSEWDFKSYVLGTMFYRYISENFAAYINVGEHAAGNTDFDYAKMSDEEAESAREGLVQEKGFFILPSELFCNVRARADKDENLNETLERVFNHIESSAASGEAENDFAGLFDDFDVNSKSIGETVAKRNKVLAELLNGVEKMPLFSTDGINPDLFGDAYEYLMGMYAANAGKKGGQYFTPADVSELLARLGTIGKTRINKVYDPACGSGSLLLKVEKVLGKDNIEQGFFGQEIDLTTYNLCRINMFLHNYIIYSIIMLISNMFFNNIRVVNIAINMIMGIYMIVSYVYIGKHILSMSNTYFVAESIYRFFFREFKKISEDTLFIKDENFQYHIKKSACKNIETLKIINMYNLEGSDVKSTSLFNFMRNNLTLLYSYMKIKNYIPHDSLWFRTVEYKKWYSAGDMEIRVALETGSFLSNGEKTDNFWFEKEILKINELGLKALIDKMNLI